MMKSKLTVAILAFMAFSCYDSQEDLTESRQFNLKSLDSNDSIIADAISLYPFLVEIPGVKYGDPKEIKFSTNWGSWTGDTDTITIPIKYNTTTDSYIDTVFLKAGRVTGNFAINVSEKSKNLGNIDFEVLPHFPTLVQIISDSLELKLESGNTTKLRILFASNDGFPSQDIRFRLITMDSVKIFPKDVFIDSTEAMATLQITNESEVGDIKVFGEFPEMRDFQNVEMDTLRIEIIN